MQGISQWVPTAVNFGDLTPYIIFEWIDPATLYAGPDPRTQENSKIQFRISLAYGVKQTNWHSAKEQILFMKI